MIFVKKKRKEKKGNYKSYLKSKSIMPITILRNRLDLWYGIIHTFFKTFFFFLTIKFTYFYYVFGPHCPVPGESKKQNKTKQKQKQKKDQSWNGAIF